MTHTVRRPHALVNTHTRVTRGTIAQAWDLTQAMSTPSNRVWPTQRWPGLELDEGLTLGSDGGHGPIRYAVEYLSSEDGVRFRFNAAKTGFAGFHSLTYAPCPDGIRWTHTLEIEEPVSTLTRLIVVLHDALIEDLLDRAEAAMNNETLSLRPFSPQVRLLRSAIAIRAQRPSAAHRPTPAGDAMAVALLALAALHAGWGMGASWPAKNRDSLQRAVISTHNLPGPLPCYGVALGLAAGALVVESANRPDRAAVPHFGLARLSTAALAGLFGLRAIWGLAESGVLARSPQPYRRYDRWFYSPLCMALAGAGAAVLRRR